MSEMLMDSTTTSPKTTKSSIFLQQFSFRSFLRRHDLSFYLSTHKTVNDVRVKRDKSLPFLKSDVGLPIWISDKLKGQCDTDEKIEAFKRVLLENADSYSFGFTHPNEKYTESAWILFKNGENQLQAVGSALTYDDMVNAEKKAELKG